ncbi:MAG TPA: LCP family protein [Nocardioidaceae bacterium]|nr:LCP family protein [Nocardioidaceae bacterium]
MTPAERHVEISRVRFRRAITLLLMTLVLPGSAQLVAGNKKIGRTAIRVVLACLGIVAFVAVLGLLWHGFVFWFGSNTFMLLLIRVGLCLLAIGWAFLFIDAWRLGQPLGLVRKQRLWMVGLNGLLTFSTVAVLLYASHLVAVQRDFIITMFGDGVASEAHDGRYNVLLLGADSGDDRWGLRTDSITVASIDEDSGQAVLFGLPRNLTAFPFPDGTVMAEQFPDGYDDTLNSLATFALDNKALFPGEKQPGIAATIQGVEGITGLKINYYAMINHQGFRDLVTALGGLTLNVRERIPVGRDGKIDDWIEPGIRKLNGYETLWYARARAGSDDYSRMARQKCVINAMVQQLSPTKVITRFEAIAKATEGLIKTNLPASELDTFAQLALKARTHPIRTVSFVPPLINTSDPDIATIHDMVEKATDGDAKPATKTSKKSKGFSRAQAQTTGGSKGSYASGYAANESENLSASC